MVLTSPTAAPPEAPPAIALESGFERPDIGLEGGIPDRVTGGIVAGIEATVDEDCTVQNGKALGSD